jgi:hypothetical protein
VVWQEWRHQASLVGGPEQAGWSKCVARGWIRGVHVGRPCMLLGVGKSVLCGLYVAACSRLCFILHVHGQWPGCTVWTAPPAGVCQT